MSSSVTNVGCLVLTDSQKRGRHFSVKQTKRVINISSIYRIKLVIIQPDLLMMSHKGFHRPEQGIPWQPHVFDHKTIL